MHLVSTTCHGLNAEVQQGVQVFCNRAVHPEWQYLSSLGGGIPCLLHFRIPFSSRCIAIPVEWRTTGQSEVAVSEKAASAIVKC